MDKQKITGADELVMNSSVDEQKKPAYEYVIYAHASVFLNGMYTVADLQAIIEDIQRSSERLRKPMGESHG